MQPSREPRVSFRWRRVRSPAPAIMPVRILSRCAPRVKPSSPRKAMPKHSETRHLPYSPEQMFDLVSDVKRYPEFLPWVTAVRVRYNNDAEMVAARSDGSSVGNECVSTCRYWWCTYN